MRRMPWPSHVLCLIISCWLSANLNRPLLQAGDLEICSEGKPLLQLVVPENDGPASDVVAGTINGHLQEWYGWQLSLAKDTAAPGSYLVVGNSDNNPIVRQLVAGGLELDDAAQGDEGFQIVSYELDDRKFIVVCAQTPAGLKHGCQELVFYQLGATTAQARVAWPIQISMQPAVAYRGCYMLPCWSAHDSMDSWRRTLRFNSELTINRNWFWLNGFPLLPQYGGIYENSALGELDNVRSLIQLCHSEAMKFCIGGGWFTWHHKESASAQKDNPVTRVGAGGGETPIAIDQQMMVRGVQYYLDLLTALPGADGLYLEPTGEGNQADDSVWRQHISALGRLLKEIDSKRPELEVSLAIGRFNSPDYRAAIHKLSTKSIYWFWAWGSPIADNALAEHPLVLRWHTTKAMSSYHGSEGAPGGDEASLTGMVTSWDPGMGFGNPWNGWAKLGVDQARDFHPYSLPYFSHQYWFRERCWDLNITEQQFAQRLSKRLFDTDMPTESIDCYLQLAAMCPEPKKADRADLLKIERFVNQHAGTGTPRNQDTLKRMQEALTGLRESM